MSRSGSADVRARPGTAGGRGWRPGARLQLLLVVALFALPVIAAFLWRPTGYVNRGELVDPARPLDDVGLATPAGEAAPLSALRPKWLLLYVGAGPCGEVCRESLYKMRQVRLTQGDDADRVAYVYVTGAALPAAEQDWLQREHPAAVTRVAGAPALERLAEQLRTPQGTPLQGIHRVYVVDPLGNLMMSYGPEAEPTAMRKDLMRLLRVSQIG